MKTCHDRGMLSWTENYIGSKVSKARWLSYKNCCDYNLYKSNGIYVQMDLAYSWTNTVLLYSVAFHRYWEDFSLWNWNKKWTRGRIQPPTASSAHRASRGVAASLLKLYLIYAMCCTLYRDMKSISFTLPTQPNLFKD